MATTANVRGRKSAAKKQRKKRRKKRRSRKREGLLTVLLCTILAQIAIALISSKSHQPKSQDVLQGAMNHLDLSDLHQAPTDESGTDVANNEQLTKSSQAAAVPTTVATTASSMIATPKADATRVATKRSRFILHVGPAKTASSTVQIDIRRLFYKPALVKDGFWYFGVYCYNRVYGNMSLDVIRQLENVDCMHKEYPEYLKRKRQSQPPRTQQEDSFNTSAAASVTTSATTLSSTTSPDVPECIQNVKTLLDAMKHKHASLIVSNEAFSYTRLYKQRVGMYCNPAFLDSWKNLLDGWDVTVVATYRRMFDWMLSSVKQYSAMGAFIRGKNFAMWPDQGGSKYPSSWPTIQDWLNISVEYPLCGRQGAIAARRWAYLDGAIRPWKDSGFHIHTLNLHDKRHITQQLMCDYVDAPRSCAALQRKERESAKNIQSIALYTYSNLVFAAAQAGLISTETQANKTRLEMTEELIEHHRALNKTFADLPLDCPTDSELESFLNLSLAKEAELMPEWYASPEGETAHRSAFQKAAYQKRSFCSIDTETVLAGAASWDDVLGRMKDAMWA